MQLLVLTFGAVFLLVLATGLLVLDRRHLRARMGSVVRSDDVAAGLFSRLHRPSAGSVEKFLDPFQKLMPRSAQESSVVRKRLVLAGFRQPFNVDLFYASKLLCPIALVVMVTITGTYDVGPFFVYALALALGFLLPDFWLGNRIKARKQNVKL